MRVHAAALVIFAMVLSTATHAQPADAKKLKDQLTGDARGAAAVNPQCKLFTLAEISAYAGVPVGPGENAGGGTGCLWSDKDDESTVMVSVVPPAYFPEPKLANGFKRLQALGPRAWVAADMGWTAGAIVQDDAIVVQVSGKKATEASAVALLQDAIKRRRK